MLSINYNKFLEKYNIINSSNTINILDFSYNIFIIFRILISVFTFYLYIIILFKTY